MEQPTVQKPVQAGAATSRERLLGERAPVGTRVGAGGRSWLVASIALAGAVAWPFVFPNPFIVTVGTLVLLNAIGASSLHLVIRTGHVSLCHAAFMGVGAYAAVLTLMKLGLPFPFNLLAAAAVPAILALLIGPVVLRLTGKYFVLVTFMLGEIIRLVFLEWTSLTGGANGIFDIPPPWPSLTTPTGFYFLSLACSALCVGLVLRILVSEIGRSIDSIRESERLAGCSGVPVVRLKVVVFIIASGLVGIQGGLHAYLLHYIDPGSFTIVQSMNFVVMNVIGGMEHLAGALIGTVFLVTLPELLRGYVDVQHVMFGIILIFIMAAMPGGIVELVARLRSWRAGQAKEEQAS